MRRKLFSVSAAMILGIVMRRFSPLFSLITVLLGAAFLFYCRKTGYRGTEKDLLSWDIGSAIGVRTSFLLLIMMLFSYAAGGQLLALQDAALDASAAEGEGTMLVRITGVTEKTDGGIRMQGTIEEPKGHPRVLNPYSSRRIIVTSYQKTKEPERLIGKTIRFRGQPEKPPHAGNPHCFDYTEYLKTKGIGLVVTAKYFTVLDTRPGPVSRLKMRILTLRGKFLSRLDVSDEVRAMIAGILFGDTGKMEDDRYDAFRNNGTAHILAVSGLHVGVIYGIYRYLIGKRRSRWITGGFLAFLLFYGTLTLWSVSVTRAILLIVLILFGDILERRYDLLTALGIASVLILIHSPNALFGASFQMSFLAVLSICFFSPVLNRFFLPSASAMLAVQLGMLPYMAYMFNLIPILSILINIPVVWLLSLIVPFGIVSMLLGMTAELFESALLSGALDAASYPLAALTQVMIEFNRAASAGGLFTIQTVSPPLAVLVLIYLTAFTASSETFQILVIRGNVRVILSLFLAVLLAVEAAVYSAALPFDRAKMVFVDVGQGDCFHVRDGADVLIDGGGRREYDVGKKILRPYLLKNGCRRLDLAMATHLHADHYLGLEQLSHCFPIRKALTTGCAGEKIRISEHCEAEILWPLERDPDSDDENRNSLIFRVTDRGVTVLITADLTAEGEEAMLEAYRGTGKLRCDILKVAHHGSKYSSTREFLEEARPKVAVISVGRRNMYGHPSPETIDRLEKCGARVFRTDRDGAVGILIDRNGNGFRVCTMKAKEAGRSGGLELQ
ncbi:MAG: DNA internalization-related competence protein ComEC/Rec2 [Anaerovoracaceae bacterium]